MKLNVTGGNVETYGDVHPELAAAAVSPHEAVIQVDGETIIAPLSSIDPSKVELACDDTGCTLIPDDGNPHNDIHPGHSHHGVEDFHGHNDHHGSADAHISHDDFPIHDDFSGHNDFHGDFHGDSYHEPSFDNHG